MAYDEDLLKEAREQLGKESQSIPAPMAVDRGLIDHYLEVFEDANPVYWDEEYASKSRFKGIIAPPGMFLSWTMPLRWTPATGPVDPTSENVQRGSYYKVKRLLHFPHSIVQKTRVEWYVPLRVGDKLSSTEVVREISPVKKTRLGEGRFWTTDLILRNQKGEVVGKQTWTSFGYR